MEKNHQTDDTPQLSSQPLTTLSIFFKVIFEDIKEFVQSNRKLVMSFSALIIFYILIHFMDTLFINVKLIQNIDRIALFVGFWIGLGILSSIGLGSGLHTFILYLGPKVARFTMASQQCGHIAQMKPHRWALMPNFECSENGLEPTLWNIFSIIKTEAIIWGFGTAVGELPPYLITRSARLAGEKNKELETELQNQKQNSSMLNQIKQKIFEYVRKYSFVTILLMASIPNPLFDLAGLTCGHLLIDFKTFFLATVIGKSLIKVNVQIIAIILILSKKSVKFITKNIGYIFGQNAKQKLEDMFNKQKQKMLDWKDSENSSNDWLGTIWNIVLIGIILFYVVSLIDSKVKTYCNSKNKKKGNQTQFMYKNFKLILINQILLS